VIVNAVGVEINREEYYPFGETSFGSFSKKRYRFTGKERDEESGLYYYGARYFAPWFARWINCDPIGMKDGLNLYSYVKNNPVIYVDKTGLSSQHADMSNIQSQQGTEGQVGKYKDLEGIKIEGWQRTIREHLAPGSQLQSLTFDAETGQADFQNQGKQYRSDTVYLNPEDKAKAKTHQDGEYLSDNNRSRQVKRMQENARMGQGPGANVNKDIIVPSIEHAVETGTSRTVANKAALGQLGNLFGLQRLSETANIIAKKALSKAKALAPLILTVGWDIAREQNRQLVSEVMSKSNPSSEEIKFMEKQGYKQILDKNSNQSKWTYQPNLERRIIEVFHELLTNEITIKMMENQHRSSHGGML